MKKFNGLVNLVLVSIMAASCISLEGQIDVTQTMSAKKKSGFLNLKTTEIQIQPDLYRAELKVNGNKSFTLKLEGRDKILIPIKSKTDLNLPANGRVFVSHDDINQPFDVSGTVATNTTYSERMDNYESCTWTVTENHCKKICDQTTECRIECKDEQVTLYGHQEISYHFQTTHRDLSVNFLKVDKGEVLATFHGSNTDVDKIIDYRGICR